MCIRVRRRKKKHAQPPDEPEMKDSKGCGSVLTLVESARANVYACGADLRTPRRAEVEARRHIPARI